MATILTTTTLGPGVYASMSDGAVKKGTTTAILATGAGLFVASMTLCLMGEGKYATAGRVRPSIEDDVTKEEDEKPADETESTDSHDKYEPP